MFNVTGGELLLILMLALIVLGPERLPDAARKLGRAVGQLRDLSGSFQREIREAFEEPSAPIIKPGSRPQLTAIDGGARDPAAPLGAAPVDGGEARATVEGASSEAGPARGESAPPSGDTPVGETPAAGSGGAGDAAPERSA